MAIVDVAKWPISGGSAVLDHYRPEAPVLDFGLAQAVEVRSNAPSTLLAISP